MSVILGTVRYRKLALNVPHDASPESRSRLLVHPVTCDLADIHRARHGHNTAPGRCSCFQRRPRSSSPPCSVENTLRIYFRQKWTTAASVCTEQIEPKQANNQMNQLRGRLNHSRNTNTELEWLKWTQFVTKSVRSPVCEHTERDRRFHMF